MSVWCEGELRSAAGARARAQCSASAMASRACPLLLLLCIGNRGASGCCNVTSFSGQLDLLLAEYDRAERPSSPVVVKAALDVEHATVDDRYASVRLLATLHLSWEDNRLCWNASGWGCSTAVTSSERLWLPDVSALNAVTGGNAAGVGLRARLHSDGRVSWLVRFDITAPISLALRAWPADEQRAVFKFGSRSPGAPFNLSVDDFTHAIVFESGGWELLQVKSVEVEGRGGGAVAWLVRLRRRAAAHALAATAALVAASLLLLAAALLAPAARPPLCATAAFVAALWMISALARLPSASAAPRSVTLMCALCVIAGLSAVGAALVLRIASCSSPPPSYLRTLVTGSKAEWSAWAAAAQLFDRLVLGAVLVALFVLLCAFLAIS